MTVRDSFHEQAENCESLGSPFTAGLLRLLADKLTIDTSVGAKVLNWQGDASFRTDAVGLRLAGALHALVIQGNDPQLAAVYPPHKADPVNLWGTVKTALLTHETHILKWLDQPPQTNEVRRSAALIPACLSLQDHFDLPLVLSELGASAGLNLNWDQYRLTLNGTDFCNSSSSVHIIPDWTGPLPLQIAPHVIEKAGCDLNPLDTVSDALRLKAYIWPDQEQRVLRTNAAIAIAQGTPATVTQSDAQDWLRNRLSKRRLGAVHVIYHTIAWQYFPPEVQKACEILIRDAGKAATDNAPIAWVSMEADGNLDSASVTVTHWPCGQTREIGRADFHGRWIKWFGLNS